MDNIKIWQIKPYIYFYIHHEELDTFVKPYTCIPEWTIMIMESGSFNYEYKNIKGSISNSSLFFCPPNTNLLRNIVKPSSFHYFRVNFKYDNGTSANEYPDIPTGEVKISNIKRVFSNCCFLQLLLTKNDMFSKYWANHIMSDIWNLYCADVSEVYLPYGIDSDDEIMNKALKLLKSKACDTIKLRSIAQSLGFSPVQFTRRFKAAFNITPFDYVTSIRMLKVQRLLVETDFTLREIAEICGYQNEYYLSTVFTHRNNINPSKYRKKYKI